MGRRQRPPAPPQEASDAAASGPAAVAGPASADPPAHVMDPIERMVHRVLEAGILVSVALLVAGVVLDLVHGRAIAPHVAPLAELPSGLVALDSGAFVSLGILTLIATPFVRVAGTMLVFALERDRRYTLVTAAVLVVMLVSVLVGRA